MNELKAYETINSKTVFEGKLLTIKHDLIKLPDGRETLREVAIRDSAAAILPIDNDGKIIFVRQYRHPAGAMTLEMPAGICEKNEDPLDCAKRELEEEIGKKTDKISLMFKYYATIGFCTEQLSIFLAEDLQDGVQNLDEDEFVTIERYTKAEALEMIKSGDIIDSKTIAAISFYLCLQNKNYIEYSN